MVKLALTSDFPSTVIDEVLARIRATAATPRVAWIPPQTGTGRERFPSARARFQSLGISNVELCDIDEAPDEQQLAHLDEYDVLYFTGGDPLVFRANMARRRVGDAVKRCLAAGRLVVGASGGAMQLTQNVSLYRLLSRPVEGYSRNVANTTDSGSWTASFSRTSTGWIKAFSTRWHAIRRACRTTSWPWQTEAR